MSASTALRFTQLLHSNEVAFLPSMKRRCSGWAQSPTTTPFLPATRAHPRPQHKPPDYNSELARIVESAFVLCLPFVVFKVGIEMSVQVDGPGCHDAVQGVDLLRDTPEELTTQEQESKVSPSTIRVTWTVGQSGHRSLLPVSGACRAPPSVQATRTRRQTMRAAADMLRLHLRGTD